MKIKPANRVNSVEEYYFSRKLKEIDLMRQAGLKVINLGIGSPDLPPSASTIDALVDNSKLPNTHGYQSYIGHPSLRKAFADWYATYFNVTLNPANEILPLLGSKEGVMHISMAFLNPGDGILIPNPGYPTYQAVANLVDAKTITYDLKEENNWYPDFEAIEKHDLSNVKMMWVNYPNMPTGQRATIKLFKDLVAFGKKHDILICNDNPYSFILNNEQLSILAVAGAKEVALELNSLSKASNMPGWRIGMIAAKPEFIDYILRVKSNMDSGMFLPVQLAAVKALENPVSWYENLTKIYQERKDYALEIMDILGCVYDKNQVGMFIWAKIPDFYEGAEALSEIILHNANVFITPGFIFGSNGNRYIRISLCSSKEVLKESKERIELIKQKLKNN